MRNSSDDLYVRQLHDANEYADKFSFASAIINQLAEPQKCEDITYEELAVLFESKYEDRILESLYFLLEFDYEGKFQLDKLIYIKDILPSMSEFYRTENYIAVPVTPTGGPDYDRTHFRVMCKKCRQIVHQDTTDPEPVYIMHQEQCEANNVR